MLTFELYVQFGIAFDTASATIAWGETAEISFTLTGADAKTDIQALADGAWKAEVKRTDNEGGTIAVTAPGDSSTGKVIVLVSDGDVKTLMRTLTFVSGVLNVSTLLEGGDGRRRPRNGRGGDRSGLHGSDSRSCEIMDYTGRDEGEIRTETLTFERRGQHGNPVLHGANIELVAERR